MSVIRLIQESDYNKGVVELLAQLTVIDKQGVTEDRFREWCRILSGNPLHKTIVLSQPRDTGGVLEETSDLTNRVNNESSNKIIGIATLFIEPKLIHNFGFVGHIEDVVVDNNHRNKGIGKKLLDSLSQMAKDQGCYKVILDCSEDNASFYEKCGFKKHGFEMSLYF
jgi:glucosamine-phosphate N-acetyltransferase